MSTIDKSIRFSSKNKKRFDKLKAELGGEKGKELTQDEVIEYMLDVVEKRRVNKK